MSNGDIVFFFVLSLFVGKYLGSFRPLSTFKNNYLMHVKGLCKLPISNVQVRAPPLSTLLAKNIYKYIFEEL